MCNVFHIVVCPFVLFVLTIVLADFLRFKINFFILVLEFERLENQIKIPADV